jgi:hypothetical protein
VATGEIGCHLIGRIPFTVAISLRHPAIYHQGIAVVHQDMAPIAGQSRVNNRLSSQQRVGIRTGAVGLVAEPESAEVALGPLLSLSGLLESLTRP